MSARMVSLRAAARLVVPAAGVTAVLGDWEAAVTWSHTDPLVLPAPSAVASALWRDRAILAPALEHSAVVVLIGLAAAVALGVLVGVALHLSRTFEQAASPLLVASQAVPVPILAPLLVVWLGFGLGAQVAIVVIVAFFPLTVSTHEGLRSLPVELDLVLRNLRSSRLNRLRLVELPHALPQVLTGLRLAVVFAVIGAVFADATGTSTTSAADPTGSGGGLGRVVSEALPQLQTDRAFAAVFLLVLLSLSLFWLVGGARRLLDRRELTSLQRTPAP